MKRILVTGIAGFIGFHLALALKKRQDFVCGCDNFNTYYDPLLKKKRAKLLLEKQISVESYDITNQEQLKKQIEENNISHVVHLAAQAGVRYSLHHPEAYIHSNLSGFVSLLEVLRHMPQIKLTYASSSSVYGLNTKVPFSETDPVNQPASFYGATKRSNELIAHAYHHMHGICSSGLRFFTVYGPWGRPDMAYYAFTRSILEDKPIPVFGRGELKRDFTYIDDIVQGTLSAIDLESDLELFNLGNRTPHSTFDLIHLLEKHLNKKAQIDFQPQPPGDVPITFADITKSQKHLGFSPKTSLEEGLEHFTSWYKINRSLKF